MVTLSLYAVLILQIAIAMERVKHFLRLAVHLHFITDQRLESVFFLTVKHTRWHIRVDMLVERMFNMLLEV